MMMEKHKQHSDEVRLWNEKFRKNFDQRNDFQRWPFFLKFWCPLFMGTMGTILACDWLRKDPACRRVFDAEHPWNWFTNFLFFQTAVYNGLVYGLQFPSLVRPFFMHHVTPKSISPWPTWITSAFNHMDGLHLMTNMFGMWLLSCNDHVLKTSITDYIDTFLCGAIWCSASLVFLAKVAFKLMKKMPINNKELREKVMVSCGASGGVYGVGGGLAYVHWDNETKYNPIPFFDPFALLNEWGFPFEWFGMDPRGLEVRTMAKLFILKEMVGMLRPSHMFNLGHLCGMAGGAFTAWWNHEKFGTTLFEDKNNRSDWSEMPAAKKLVKFFKDGST